MTFVEINVLIIFLSHCHWIYDIFLPFFSLFFFFVACSHWIHAQVFRCLCRGKNFCENSSNEMVPITLNLSDRETSTLALRSSHIWTFCYFVAKKGSKKTRYEPAASIAVTRWCAYLFSLSVVFDRLSDAPCDKTENPRERQRYEKKEAHKKKKSVMNFPKETKKKYVMCVCVAYIYILLSFCLQLLMCWRCGATD